jgi:hypothetical protein
MQHLKFNIQNNSLSNDCPSYLSAMKTLSTALVLLFVSLIAKAQKQVELADISKHIGDSVTVKGKVFSSRAVSNGKLLLLNLGAAFPNQLLTVVMGEEIQKVAAEALKLDIQELSVAGKVELFREKPQIVIKSPEQIKSIITEKAGAKD